MLTLIPWPYRLAAIAALALAVYFYGYTNGHVAQLEADNEKFAEIRATQDQQAIHAGKVALDRQATISAVVDGYEDERSRLAAYYAKCMRDPSACGRTSPVPADSLPADANWRPAYAALVEAYSGLGKQFIGLEGECATTTLMFVNLRKAAMAVETIQ